MTDSVELNVRLDAPGNTSTELGLDDVLLNLNAAYNPQNRLSVEVAKFSGRGSIAEGEADAR